MIEPVAESRPHLVPVYTPGAGVLEGPGIRLEEGRTLLGREEGTGVLAFPEDNRVSRHHAGLTVSADPWRVSVEDLGSKNGTFVNGRPVEQTNLVDGDLVRVGESFFVLRLTQRAEEPASDIKGRAPAMASLRRAMDRLSPHSPRVLLEGVDGAIFDDLMVAAHRRINPEGRTLRIDGSECSPDELRDALAGTASVLLSNLDGLSASSASVLTEAVGMAPVVASTTHDVEAGLQSNTLNALAFEPFLQHRMRVPRLSERREDLLGLLFSALGSDLPPPTADLVETLLIYGWSGDMHELVELATELRVRGSGLDALVTELVSPRMRGHIASAPDDPMTQVDVRRPVPSRQDLEGLMVIHGGDVNSIAEAMGRSRLEVLGWMQKHDIGESPI